MLYSWTIHRNENIIREVIPSDKHVRTFIMPPKTTPMVQPLDKYGFRIWKNFVRKFSDKVLLEQIPVDFFQRDNVIKLQAIVHNQLSSPRCIRIVAPRWKFYWYACSYPESHPGHFENPESFTFGF